MNKILFTTILLAVVAALGLTFIYYRQADEGTSSNEDDAAIRAHVIAFSKELKNVPLLMPRTGLGSTMEEHYGSYLTPELLSKWQNDPGSALGRSVSSPWPDRIEVVTVIKNESGTYTVEGNVVEVTGADASMEPAAVYPVTITVENRNGAWKIAGVEKGSYGELSKRITVFGEWECLPHADTQGPQTLECAFGLKTDDGKHYGIDLKLLEIAPVTYPTGARVRAEGLFVPAEALSSNVWQKYPIEGILSVTAIEEI